MRYKLDSNGFVKYVLFGCYTGNCAEYTGAVPSGYSDLTDWANNACINAYYLDENGDLVLDVQRMNYLHTMYEQQEIDYAPVLHKDLYATNEIIEAQYKKSTASGTIITVANARGIAPMVKISGLTGNSLSVFAQTKNMLRNDAISLEVNGLTFTRDGDGITISGTATADVEYTISGGEAEPLFALLQSHSYCLFVGGYECELLYYDGETTEQVYTGLGGVINLSESKRVTEVKLKFASGQTVNDTIYPTLAYGTSTIAYEECQTKVYDMELPEYEEGASIIIGEGLAVLYSGNETHVVGRSNMGLLNGYNMIYTSQGNPMEITYTTNEFLIDDMAFLQGTATTSRKFMILDDGSIQATDGKFSGEVTCTKLTVGDNAEIIGILVGVTEEDAKAIANAQIRAATIYGDQIYAVNITATSSYDSRISVTYGREWAEMCPGVIQVSDSYNSTDIFSDGISTGYIEAAKWKYYGSDYTPGDCAGVYHDHDGESISPDVVDARLIYTSTSTTSSNSQAAISTNGLVCKYGSSSKRYKHNIHSLSEEMKAKFRGLYDVEVKNWTYNDGYLEEGDELVGKETFGLIAEDVAEVLPEAVHYEDGMVENYRDRQLINAMLVLLQDQKKEIEALKEAITKIGGTV